MDATRRAETLRWARALARSDDATVGAAGRTILSLIETIENGGVVDPARLARMRHRAREFLTSGDRELRAAARAVLMLADEVDPPRSRSPLQPSREARAPAFPTRRAVSAVVAALAVGCVLAVGVLAARRFLAPGVDASGPPAGAVFGRRTLSRAVFTARGAARWDLDGRDVSGQVTNQGGRLVFAPRMLPDGKHNVVVKSRSGFLGARTVRRFAFRVDTKAPVIRIVPRANVHARQPLVVRGAVDADARLAVAGRATTLDHGAFVIRRAPPLPRTLVLRATDAAGNVAVRRLTVAVVPRRPRVPVRGVHMTAYAWADRDLRAGVMKLVRERRVTAVELDLKDESGVVGFPADAQLAQRAGAVRDIYDLAKAVRELHRLGIRVIGRLVCFRDPVLAAAAWTHGRRDQVIQTPAHRPYAGYGGFTNFANPEVRRYNIEIAVAAAKLGVDDVLFDYVRRPDGPIGSMRFPGLRASPEKAIVRFLHESRLALRPYGTYLGASVFGVAATRPREVAQPIGRMARELDYVAPMVYPSHWGRGEYDVANPNSQPYQIVLRSLRDFSRDVAGSGARVVPWLQDFSLGVTYGPSEVTAQIRAARRDGIPEFLLWDPNVTYTEAALPPNAPTQTSGTEKATSTKRRGGRLPNELGQIPVIMHHEIRPDRVGPYDQTPAEFRSELERLWREGYYPVTTEELVDRKLDRVPRGKTPVVLTFDDATRYQLFFRGRQLVRTTAIGVLLQFARTHPGFPATGSIYVLREPFGGVPQGAAWLRWLVEHGFELGNHTYDHVPLNTLPRAQVARELALGEKVITDAVPGYRVRTMSLPLGAMPRPAILASRGQTAGRRYGPYGVLLVGANPAPSPYSRTWDATAIPRIRSSHAGWNGEPDLGASYWLRELAAHPESRYVSDGDRRWVTVPRSRMPELAPRFHSRARPY